MRGFDFALFAALAAAAGCGSENRYNGSSNDLGSSGAGGTSASTASGDATSGDTTGAGVSTTGASGATTGGGPTGSGSTTSGTTGSGSTGAGGASTTGATSGAGGSGGDPFGTPEMCSSNAFWTAGDQGSVNMKPGSACDTCHVLFGKASKKVFDVAGTVYPSAHEPDDCNGTNLTGVKIVITDANNADHILDVNAVGNFYHDTLFGLSPFPAPYKAKITYNGKELKMIAPVMSGDCDSCHTDQGTQNAPGRIILPF